MSKQIIISGCGGGYDIFGGMTLYYRFKDIYEIIVCNLSFTRIEYLETLAYNGFIKSIIPGCFEVPPGNYVKDSDEYFPEYLLANSLKQSVYAICNYDTVRYIVKFYNKLLEIYNRVECIYLVDGGCDVLLTGNETGLATPVEDMMHLKALQQIDKIPNKFVCAIGMNVDCGHGVIEDELVQRLETMRFCDIILEETILDLVNPETKFYYYIVMNCKPENSIVQGLIIMSLEGNYGYNIPKILASRMISNEVNVSELTKRFIICDFNKLANSILYLNDIESDMNSDQVDDFIENFIQKKNKI